MCRALWFCDTTNLYVQEEEKTDVSERQREISATFLKTRVKITLARNLRNHISLTVFAYGFKTEKNVLITHAATTCK